MSPSALQQLRIQVQERRPKHVVSETANDFGATKCTVLGAQLRIVAEFTDSISIACNIIGFDKNS